MIEKSKVSNKKTQNMWLEMFSFQNVFNVLCTVGVFIVLAKVLPLGLNSVVGLQGSQIFITGATIAASVYLGNYITTLFPM
jgi:hypothetical protein